MFSSSVLVIWSLSNPTPAALICIPLRLILGRLIFVVLGRCSPGQNQSLHLKSKCCFLQSLLIGYHSGSYSQVSQGVRKRHIVIFVESCCGQGHGYEAATYFVLNSSDAVEHFNPFICYWLWVFISWFVVGFGFVSKLQRGLSETWRAPL